MEAWSGQMAFGGMDRDKPVSRPGQMYRELRASVLESSLGTTKTKIKLLWSFRLNFRNWD